jgi:hypothetical protein
MRSKKLKVIIVKPLTNWLVRIGERIRIEAVSNRADRRRQERQGRKEMRGFGSVYRTKWRDKKTGQIRYSPRYTIKYYHNKELIRELTPFTKESDAWKLLKKRHGELALGKPTSPTVSRTAFEDMAAMLVNDYKANRRRSLKRAEDALDHLRSFLVRIAPPTSRAIE